jgi:hypothetical protein
MYIYTQNGEIINTDAMAVIETVNNDVVAFDSCKFDGWLLGNYESEEEARQEIQKIMTAIDHGRSVYYIGEFELPF